eukprot:SAG11_NODE_21208_length_429_cov_2.545455_1_plen_32_part_10
MSFMGRHCLAVLKLLLVPHGRLPKNDINPWGW